jgi:hypothetical protein
MRTALLLAAVVSLFPQSAVQPFDGTWTADFQDRPLVRLELHAADSALTGRIQLADIHVDSTGAVDRVDSALSAPAPLFDVIVRDRTLSFTRHDDDDVDPFQLVLLADGRAELRFLPTDAIREELARAGIPVPRPLTLFRVKP